MSGILNSHQHRKPRIEYRLLRRTVVMSLLFTYTDAILTCERRKRYRIFLEDTCQAASTHVMSLSTSAKRTKFIDFHSEGKFLGSAMTQGTTQMSGESRVQTSFSNRPKQTQSKVHNCFRIATLALKNADVLLDFFLTVVIPKCSHHGQLQSV
jgi:hypothetical protein